MQKTLKEFIPGEFGAVVTVTASGAVRRRLFDMGITPGVGITMRKRAPLGDPIEVTLRGYQLSLRQAEANEIMMETEALGNAVRFSRESQLRKNNLIQYAHRFHRAGRKLAGRYRRP